MTALGLVGRTVMAKVTRAGVSAAEPCEVVACQAAGEYANWHILVATHDGVLIDLSYANVTLVANSDVGPYR